MYAMILIYFEICSSKIMVHVCTITLIALKLACATSPH